jgi:hypothetical protein
MHNTIIEPSPPPHNAPKPAPLQIANLEPRLAMKLGGGGLLALALLFLWRDLGLPHQLVMLVPVALGSAATWSSWPRNASWVGPAVLCAAVAGTGIWFLADKSAALLLPSAAACMAGVMLLALAERKVMAASDQALRLTWYAAGAAAWLLSWQAYLQFGTLDVLAETVARRMVPTFLWMASGLGLFIAASRRHLMPGVHVALALVAVATGKALIYDTSHLSGSLRVITLAGAGVLMLFASHLARGSTPKSGRGL